MSTLAPEIDALARELLDARASGRDVTVPPSERDGGFTLDAAYAVEAELTRLRRADGRTVVGRKVGYANRAVWRALKLQTLVWANMYDDTVQFAGRDAGTFAMAGRHAPRIEPEVVFKLKHAPQGLDVAATLDAAEWVALGFEIVDAPYPGWKFHPVDFVASFGLHAALIVGEPRPIQPGDFDALAAFKVRLSRNGELVEEGAGKNALKSPALCLAELASAIAARPGAEPLQAGELISTGTLTSAQPVKAGERWSAEVEGIELAAVTAEIAE
jgi:2-oxo-3-hexenedioate decarboxylase